MNQDKQTTVPIAVAAVVSTVVVVATLAVAGTDHGWLLAARYTARWSFVTFLAAFLAPMWLRGRIGRNPRALIVGFGAAHGIHLAVLITYRVMAGERPEVAAPAIGGLAYGLIVVLVFAEIVNRSNRWLRTIALHYALLVFVLTYATRLSSADQYWTGVIGVTIGALALVIRMAATMRNRRMAQLQP